MASSKFEIDITSVETKLDDGSPATVYNVTFYSSKANLASEKNLSPEQVGETVTGWLREYERESTG